MRWLDGITDSYIGVLSNESALCIRWPKSWSFSFSFSISQSNEYSELISLGLTGFILLSKGLSRVFSCTTQKHQFFGTHPRRPAAGSWRTPPLSSASREDPRPWAGVRSGPRGASSPVGAYSSQAHLRLEPASWRPGTDPTPGPGGGSSPACGPGPAGVQNG